MPIAPEHPLAQVLLVEDDSDLGNALQASMAGDHVTLVFAQTAQQALDVLRRQPVELVLLDLGLPGMDGFEFLETLRQEPSWQHLPVIILTAKTSAADKVRGFELGANDYVTKPFSVVELRARVRSSLRIQKLQMELLRANRELEHARAAAEESGNAKADFLANMSHEIRTPMNGVIAMTGLLMQTDLSSDQRDFVETIRTSGESLLTIINDILNFSKLESGKMELEQRPFNLRDCIEETLELLATKAAEKNLDLAYRVAPHSPEQAVGDVTRLRQILVNLLSNAIKFTPAGEILIEVASQRLPAARAADPVSALPAPSVAAAAASEPETYEFHITVRDTGIGIPKDRLGRLFQAYGQADSSIARQFGGTGLGLAISKGLVELMGGKIWVESDEGKGSTFHFTLRLPASAAGQSPLDQPSSQFTGLRVLIAENNAAMRGVLAAHARAWGLTPVEAPTARHALDQVRAGATLDLAIIDAVIGGMDGATLAAELRQCQNLQALPIVFMTRMGSRGAPSQIVLNRCAQVSKPIRPAQLQQALLQVLSGAKQEARKAQPASRLDGAMGNRLPLRILLADDNVINQKVALRLLQQLGYKADTANNGAEAVQAVERKSYDIILMDVQMPEMDGLEATRRIRQHQKEAGARESGGSESSGGHGQKPIVIIAMTANAMQGDREKCMAAGMNDYLPKPVRPEALQALLEQHGAQLAKAALSDGSQPEKTSPTEAAPAVAPHLTILPPPVPGASAEPPVDLERLNEFAGGSSENFNELVTLYVKQTTDQLEQIRVALTSRDAERASRLAHSCAGASATCGMTIIVPLLRQVETLTRDENLAAAAELMPAIGAEFERLQRFLQTHKPIALAS